MGSTIHLVILSVIVSVVFAEFQLGIPQTLQTNQDIGLNISQYLSKYGYEFEEHPVETEDGFVISLHRIPAQTAGAPVIFLVHAFLCSAFDWVSQGPGTSLALLLWDLGYDVWLYNARGTHYSSEHTIYNNTQEEYWNFTYHEKGNYDLKTSIDYILSATNQANLTLVAHSQGTSSTMALLSTNTEYNEKLNLLVLMSPIGYMGGVTSPIPLWMAEHITEIMLALDLLKVYGYSYSESVSKVIGVICSIDGFTAICRDFLGLLCGYDSEQADLEYIQLFVSDKPSGGSIKELQHYGQEMNAGAFRRFDYGILGNLVHYGTTEPPAYDPSLITVPVATYYGKNDFLASVEDVETLLAYFPNKVESYLIDFENFNHLDFLLAKDVKTLVYDKVIAVIANYTTVV